MLGLLLMTASTSAHRQWMLPSTSVLSGQDQWISVEAAISNDLFFPNHHALGLDLIKAQAPDGSALELQSATEGKIRSSFELKLEGEGTYRIISDASRFFARWEENGEPKRWRGFKEDVAEEGILEKPGVQLGNNSSRVETYVTSGAPTQEILQPSGQGLELDSFPTRMTSLSERRGVFDC